MGQNSVRTVIAYLLVSRAASLAVPQEPQGEYIGTPVAGVTEEFMQSFPSTKGFPFGPLVAPLVTRPEPYGSVDSDSSDTDSLDSDGDTRLHGSCTAYEKAVLVPVEILTERIKGKIDTNETFMPGQWPKECSFGGGGGGGKGSEDYSRFLQGCYKAWGFSDDVAECWAQEAEEKFEDCISYCAKTPANTEGHKSQPCQGCLATLRQNRRKCTWRVMHISRKCVNCQLAAFKYWDQNCMMICRDIFNEVDTSTSVDDCRQCNSEHVKRLKICGAE